jgi:hypothetical protein
MTIEDKAKEQYPELKKDWSHQCGDTGKPSIQRLAFIAGANWMKGEDSEKEKMREALKKIINEPHWYTAYTIATEALK